MATRVNDVKGRIVGVVQAALGDKKRVEMTTRIEGVDVTGGDMSAMGVGRFNLMIALETEFLPEKLKFPRSPAACLERMGTVADIVLLVQELLSAK